MSGGIEEPYAIAALAKPLDGKHGRIVGASVHSIAGSRKRKRHEVAIGVDGESVSIYHVCANTLSSNYVCVYTDNPRHRTRAPSAHTPYHRNPTSPPHRVPSTANEQSRSNRRGRHIWPSGTA